MSFAKTIKRNKLKKIYKKFREEDAELGREFNRLMQVLFAQDRLPEEKRDKDLIMEAVSGAKELRAEQ